jgi:predicted nuclease of predicted toxin-antitoxin system
VKVKLDENVTQEAVAVLVDAGHDVQTVRSEQLVGASDAKVWDACLREQRMLVTFDLGFADVRAYPPGHHVGVVALRLTDQQPAAVVDVLRRLLADYDLDTLVGCLAVVADTRVRVRRP